jgi:two-component system sensor histidine kinase HydH
MSPLKKASKRFWNEVPALVFVGSLLILSPIFVFITVNNIRIQEQNTETLLTEKCTALIRSFEASTRSGILEGPGDIRQLQKLLYETARQPDIEYLLVADTNGTIIAHSNYLYTGVMLNLMSDNKKLDLTRIADSNALYKQVVTSPEGKRTFVVFRRFSPTGPPNPGAMINYFSSLLNNKNMLNFNASEKIIVVALDMSSVDAVRKIYFKNAIVTGIILLLTGITGIILLFMIQGYRSARSTLSKVTVFSNTLVENMPVGLIAMDKNQNIMSLNHEAKSILSITNNEDDSQYLSLLPMEMQHILSTLGKDKDVLEHEIECTMPDGKSLPLEINAAVLRDHENELSGTICLFKDLDRKSVV